MNPKFKHLTNLFDEIRVGVCGTAHYKILDEGRGNGSEKSHSNESDANTRGSQPEQERYLMSKKIRVIQRK